MTSDWLIGPAGLTSLSLSISLSFSLCPSSLQGESGLKGDKVSARWGHTLRDWGTFRLCNWTLFSDQQSIIQLSFFAHRERLEPKERRWVPDITPFPSSNWTSPTVRYHSYQSFCTDWLGPTSLTLLTPDVVWPCFLGCRWSLRTQRDRRTEGEDRQAPAPSFIFKTYEGLCLQDPLGPVSLRPIKACVFKTLLRPVSLRLY